MKKLGIFISALILSLSISGFVFAEENIPNNDFAEENSRYSIVLEENVFTYTGEEIQPEFEVRYKENDEVDEYQVIEEEYYTVVWENNVNVSPEGTPAKIIVTGVEEKGYRGSIESEFVIEAKPVNELQINLETASYLYDGKEKTPTVEVKFGENVLTKDIDYEVVYKNNVKPGTATVVVKGLGNFTGEVSKGFKIMALGKMSSLSTTPSDKKIKVSWKKIQYADGYQIYRGTTSGKYKRIATVKGGNTVSYTDTSVKNGTTYYYKVRAYRVIGEETYYNASSAEKKQRSQVAKVGGVATKAASYNSIKVTWNKVSGANGYGVYRSTSKNGKFTKIKTIKPGSTVSCTDTKLTCGQTYYYKVVAYQTTNKTNYYGSYSDVVSGSTVPSTTKFTSSTNASSSSVKLVWSKSSGAKGYEIYRNEGAGYKLVKIITSGSTTSWENTGLDKEIKYQYKIRPYTTVSGKKVYGKYSAVYTRNKAGWRYVNGYKLYYNNKGEVVQDVRNLIGKQDSYVIKVNRKQCVTTVYAKDGENGYIIPVVAFVCSPGTGSNTPLGTFNTQNKYRWHLLYKGVYGQWDTRITGHVLFHSVYYNGYNNKNTLSVTAYNRLGRQDSMGCIRLTAGDAKWVYDNCKLNTKVVIYSSSKAEPLKKPTAYKLPSWHTWDPTDPTAKSKCKSRGCH